jgi:CBS domain containing-hemolysin-like protein
MALSIRFAPMLIALAVFCTLIEAVFTALEVAMGAVSRSRLRAVIEAGLAQENAHDNPENNKRDSQRERRSNDRRSFERSRRLLSLLDHPERLNLMFIVVTSLCLWTAASALTWQANREAWPIGAWALSLVVVLFVAEVLPLLVAAHRPESVALGGANLASLALIVLRPLTTLLGGIGYGAARLFGAASDASPQVTEGEIRTALAAAEEEGVIESDERALLEGAMDFRETRVREVMTPRPDMVAVPVSAKVPEILELAMREGHSRLPVYEGTTDRIVGIVSCKDLVPHLRANSPARSQEITALDVIRPAFFVPEDKRIAPTLDELRHQRTLMAIVVDEHGGTAGLITLEDLLEELVGEIQDEYDEEEPAMRIISGAVENKISSNEAATEDVSTDIEAEETTHAILCDGDVTVRDVQRFWRRSFGENIILCDNEGPADEGASLAALALRLFESVPAPGSRVAAGNLSSHLESDDEDGRCIDLQIEEMSGARIERIILRRFCESTEEEEKE